MRDAQDYPVDADLCPASYWHLGFSLDLGAEVSGDPITVVVNHGRWIVACPDCTGAQLAALNDPRFMCVDCANQKNRGAWRPVTLPDPDVRPDIEAVLDIRPDVKDQNWLPTETVNDLAQQNLDLGLPLPDGVVVLEDPPPQDPTLKGGQ